MSVVVVLGCLVVVLAGTAALEGTTVGRSTRVVGAGGEVRLRRIGWSFLFTEVWFVAFLGLGHAVLPQLFHQMLVAAWLPITVYGLGWMIRDVGLWQVALFDRVRWAPVVAAGAWVQVVAGVGAGAFTVVDFIGQPPVFTGPAPVVSGLLAVVAPVCLVVVGALQLWWWRLGRRARTT